MRSLLPQDRIENHNPDPIQQTLRDTGSCLQHERKKAGQCARVGESGILPPSRSHRPTGGLLGSPPIPGGHARHLVADPRHDVRPVVLPSRNRRRSFDCEVPPVVRGSDAERLKYSGRDAMVSSRVQVQSVR
jgi:hypothetical protein